MASKIRPYTYSKSGTNNILTEVINKTKGEESVSSVLVFIITLSAFTELLETEGAECLKL